MILLVHNKHGAKRMIDASAPVFIVLAKAKKCDEPLVLYRKGHRDAARAASKRERC